MDDTIHADYAGGNMTTGAVREGRAGVTGRRIATTSGTNVVRHVYDGMHVVADTDAAGNLLRSYAWGPGIDNLLAMTVYGPGGTNTYQAISDHLGTVHALVTPSGTVAERYEYDAWGNVLGVFDGNGGSLPSSVLGLRYLFQGREYSWATHEAWGGAGLYYFRARWYDPSTGRWLSNDPIGISGGLNQYAFCSNNPVNCTDPTGLDAHIIWEHFLQKGHAQIAVDVYDSAGNVVGEKAYGFRPTDVSFKYPKVLLGIDIPGIAQEEKLIPGPEQIDNIPLSPALTREMQNIIEQNLGTEPYNMYDKNCIDWINRILQESIDQFKKTSEECSK